ncbi:MAG: ABC transporter permease subunit [Candidatus Omnitrophica bacterium]|nr:ABC transporter permease subunit [Candidatus Omnitrophota bacterium]MBD3269085.1 ABC transporter permease subunit [Candidatus Omnitrophota bacterium]
MKAKKVNLFFKIVLIFTGFLALWNTCLYAGKSQKLRVALTGKFPPFSFYSGKGRLIGFDVDVSKAIARKLNRDLEIVTTEWDGILAGLLAGKYDAIIGSMAKTPQREEVVNFSIPYYISGAQLFIHEDNKDEIENIDALRGKRIGVGLGETYEHYLRKNYPDIQVVTYKSTVDIFQDMLNGRIDGFVTDKLVGLYQIEKGRMPFVTAGKLLYEESIAIPVVQERPQLLKKINKALAEMKRKGELAAIYKKWFEEKGKDFETAAGIETKIIVKKLGKGFAITLLVAFSALLMGFVLAIPSAVILNNKAFFIYYPLRSFNDFIRGTPLLIQLFFVYFGAPQVGVMLTPIQAAILTLTVNSSAYMSEVIRSGLMSVDCGQILAAKALGLSRLQSFRYIIWPQAFRIALPPLMNSVVALMKDTALIAVISVGEVIREAQSIISVTYNPMKYYFIVAVMFFIFTFPLMKLAGRIEKKIKEKGFANA